MGIDGYFFVVLQHNIWPGAVIKADDTDKRTESH